MNERPEKGDFCYVDLVGRGTFEGIVVASGRDYEVRLKDTGEVVEAPNSEVWTAPPTPSV
jgi:hypothetical protein